MSHSRVIRAAMTQTVNAYHGMPRSIAELGQLTPKLAEIRRANVDHHLELLAAAKSEGAQVVLFGELFAGPYFALGKESMWRGLAESAEDGETVSAVRVAAREHGVVVIAPIYELTAEGRRFNTAVVISESGTILGKYRKTHIPEGANEQASFHETFYYERSDGQNGTSAANVSKNPYFPVFQTHVARMGVAICYDRHFEGVMSTLATEGAELVFCPAVTFGSKSQRMWPIEFQADAARHNLFIGGSNRKGAEAPWDQPYFGESHFVGPNGPIQNQSRHPNLVVADLDLGELSADDPSGWNLPRDSRPEIYFLAGRARFR